MYHTDESSAINRRYHHWSLLNSPLQLSFSMTIMIIGGSRTLVTLALACTAAMSALLFIYVHPVIGSPGKRRKLRPADWVTICRLGAAMIIPLLLIRSSWGGAFPAFIIGVVATILDGVDGKLARTYGSTRFGEILDIETDTAFVQLAVVGAVSLLSAPPVMVLLSFWRYLYILSFKYIRSPSPLPTFWRYLTKWVGVLGTSALGVWYLQRIPRQEAAWYLYGIAVLTTLAFMVTWYFHLDGRSHHVAKA